MSAHLAATLGEVPTYSLPHSGADAGHDALLTCTYRDQHHRYAVSVKETLARSSRALHGPTSWLSAARATSGATPLVVTSHISEGAAEKLRSHDIQYIDALGNAHLHFGAVLLDVRGRRPTPRSSVRDQRGTRSATSLTSPRRAQIIMCMLAWPALLQGRLQDLAEASGTSPSQVHQTLNLLREAGYVVDKELVRHRVPELLELWASAYATQLGPTLALGEFTSSLPGQWPELPVGTLAHISGEGVRDTQMRPTTTTIYVEAIDPALARLNRWVRTERPNVFVRKRFWRSPDEHPHATGTHDAPWPMVYADLLVSQDPRHREAARDWRDTHAR